MGSGSNPARSRPSLLATRHVAQAAVVVREDVPATSGWSATCGRADEVGPAARVRGARLPDYMVPSAVVVLLDRCR